MKLNLLHRPNGSTGTKSMMQDGYSDKQSSLTARQIVLIVEYDGTSYAGFQLQKNSPSIQGELEKSIKKLTGEFARVYGSSRTDSGVHALGQVVSFKTTSDIEISAYTGGLNYYLPDDISVTRAFRASPEFNVRRNAVSREYRYFILNREARSPLEQGFYMHLKGRLDIDAMNQACGCMVGRHDFSSFASPISPLGSTWRHLETARVAGDEGSMLVFTVVANAFLPHQVRNMVGSLVRVGQGKMTVKEFKSIMEARTPGLAQPTAPARGLVLYRVNYAKELKGDSLE